MTIRIHIDRLVLDGIPLDRNAAVRLQESLVAQLTAQAADGSLDWTQLEALDAARIIGAEAPSITLPPRPDGRELGRSIARALTVSEHPHGAPEGGTP